MFLFLESENFVMYFCWKYFCMFVVLLIVYDFLVLMWKIKVLDVGYLKYRVWEYFKFYLCWC